MRTLPLRYVAILAGILVLAGGQATAQQGPRFDREELTKSLRYPSAAVARQVRGAIDIDAQISAEGKATGITIKTSSLSPAGDESLFKSAIQSAVQSTHFTPARTRTGTVVPGQVHMTIWFEFEGMGREHHPSVRIGYVNSHAVIQDNESALPENGEFILVEEEATYNQLELQRNIHYPEAAKREEIEGRVVVSALISKTGEVTNVVVEKSDHAILADAAIAAIRKTPFTPARDQTGDVATWIQIEVNFSLIDGEQSVRVVNPA